MQKEKLYVAYGSNINLSQMAHRCPTAKVVGTSEIKDYELVFRGSKTGSYANIEPCEGSSVPVVLWSIKPKDEVALDRYEGYPRFYDKENMKFNINGEDVIAFVYVMTEGHKLGLPSELYRKTIEDGYKTVGFYTDILENAIVKTEIRMANEQENAPEQERLFGLEWW